MKSVCLFSSSLFVFEHFGQWSPKQLEVPKQSTVSDRLETLFLCSFTEVQQSGDSEKDCSPLSESLKLKI